MKAPCKNCPWRRGSLAGWLGASDDAADFIAHFWHGHFRQPCHSAVDWDRSDVDKQVERAPTCKGALTTAKNTCKSFIDPRMEFERQITEIDHETVFSNVNEFIKHHDGGFNADYT